MIILRICLHASSYLYTFLQISVILRHTCQFSCAKGRTFFKTNLRVLRTKLDFARLLRSLNFGYKFYTYCRTKNEKKKIRVCRDTLIACRWRNPWVSHRLLKYDIQWSTNQLISRPCPKQCTLFRSLYLCNAKNIAIFRYGYHLHLPCIKSDNLHTQQIWIWTEQYCRHFH